LYKWVARNQGDQLALGAIAITEQANIIPLSTPIALSAADFSAKYKLSFADAVIYVTAVFLPAILITLPGCSLNNSQAIIALTYFECN
jgi:predicted nucleic acid-binding protein